MRKLFLTSLLLLALAVSGCGATAQNTDWATELAGNGNGATDEIQAALDAYADALVSKDRNAFLAVVDPENAAFTSQQDQLFTNLEAVPFSDYSINVTSKAEAGIDIVSVKVEIAYTLTGSFSELPQPDRFAYYMVKKESGWKLSGDATEQVLGKKREAGLEDFSKIIVTEGDHVIVLSHTAEAGLAAEIRDLTDAAYPRLQDTLPGIELPKVPVRLFSSKAQIDAAYPGTWQEWVGGAARQLGDTAGQGGDIIIDAGTFRETSLVPDYNRSLLAHELTHVALFPRSGLRTPPFLVEGLADYVGGIEPVVLLRDKLRSGGAYSPTLSDLYEPSGFSTLLTTEAATLAYESSDMAVEYLILTYGNAAVLDLLDEFKGREHASSDQAELVDEAFREVLGISWAEFEESWRNYVLNG